MECRYNISVSFYKLTIPNGINSDKINDWSKKSNNILKIGGILL